MHNRRLCQASDLNGMPGLVDINFMRMNRVTLMVLVLAAAWAAPMLVAGAASETDGAQVRQLVRDWADAWSDGRFDEYLSYYLGDFRGQHGSRAAWKEQRRSRVAGRKDISIDLGPVLVQFNLDDPNIARAVFLQSYKSPTWCDVVEKTLDLQRTPAGWRISGETATTRRRC